MASPRLVAEVDDLRRRRERCRRLCSMGAVSPKAAAEWMGVSDSYFRRRILPALPFLREGTRILVPVVAINDYLAAELDDQLGEDLS